MIIEIDQETVVLHCVRWQLCHSWGARRTAFYRTKHWLASFREGKVCIYISGKLSKQQCITNAQNHCLQHLPPKRLPMWYASLVLPLPCIASGWSLGDKRCIPTLVICLFSEQSTIKMKKSPFRWSLGFMNFFIQ